MLHTIIRTDDAVSYSTVCDHCVGTAYYYSSQAGGRGEAGGRRWLLVRGGAALLNKKRGKNPAANKK